MEKTASEIVNIVLEKLAEDPSTKQRVLAGLLGGAGGAIGAPEGEGLSTFGNVAGGGVLGTAAGAGIGGAGGAGIGALIAALTKGRVRPQQGAAAGGIAGGLLGGLGGQQVGFQKGLTHAAKGWDQPEQ